MHLITNFLLVLPLSFCKLDMYGFLYTLADWLFHLLHWKHFRIDKKRLKLFTFSRYLSSFYWSFSHVEQTSWLERLTSKVVTSELVQQTNPIRILLNISRSKGHQTMKFDQLIDYKRYVFLQKWWRKWGRDTTYRPPSIYQKCFL